jgi:DNA-binding MarR family transcriptional regulator
MSDAPDHLLHILRETFLSEVRSDRPDLTMRQLAVALTVYQTDRLQTIRDLAKHLDISTSAVSRTLGRLSHFDLVRRKIDLLDRRSTNVMRTSAGTAMMQRLADAMAVANRG